MVVEGQTKRTRFTIKPAWGVLAVIVFLALGLRLWGIDNGMPYAQTTDETSDIMRMLKVLAGEPPSRVYHRVTWSIAQLPVHALHYVSLWVTEPGFDLAAFEARYYTHVGEFIMWSRVYNAVLSALGLIFVYIAGTRLTQRVYGGLLTAALFAVHPLHVYMAKIAIPDSFGFIWVMLVMLSIILVIQKPSRWTYLLAGFAGAGAMLARLQTSLMFSGLLLAHIVVWLNQSERPRKLFYGPWGWALLGFVGGQIIMDPFIILTPDLAVQSFLLPTTSRLDASANALSGWLPRIIRELDNPWVMVRWYVGIGAAVGLFIAVVKHRVMPVIIAFATMTFFMGLWFASSNMKNSYWFPALIPLLLVAAYGCIELIKMETKWIRWMGIALSAGLLLISGYETLRVNHIMAAPNTRMEAYDWVTEHVPEGSRILIGGGAIYSVPLMRNEESILRAQSLGYDIPSMTFWLNNPDTAPHPQYDLFGIEYVTAFESDEDFRLFLSEHDIDYVVDSTVCGAVVYDTSNKVGFPILTDAVREELIQEEMFSPFVGGECLHPFSSRLHLSGGNFHEYDQIGTMVTIYAVPD